MCNNIFYKKITYSIPSKEGKLSLKQVKFKYFCPVWADSGEITHVAHVLSGRRFEQD